MGSNIDKAMKKYAFCKGKLCAEMSGSKREYYPKEYWHLKVIA